MPTAQTTVSDDVSPGYRIEPQTVLSKLSKHYECNCEEDVFIECYRFYHGPLCGKEWKQYPRRYFREFQNKKSTKVIELPIFVVRTYERLIMGLS